eukprot:Gb_18405 [translate_table: standard]
MYNNRLSPKAKALRRVFRVPAKGLTGIFERAWKHRACFRELGVMSRAKATQIMKLKRVSKEGRTATVIIVTAISSRRIYFSFSKVLTWLAILPTSNLDQIMEIVQRLQKQLQEEIDLHSTLESAIGHPAGALSRLPRHLPIDAQELLANVAMLEVTVSKLEEEMVSLHFQLSQERNERRLAEYRLKHSPSPSPSLSPSEELKDQAFPSSDLPSEHPLGQSLVDHSSSLNSSPDNELISQHACRLDSCLESTSSLSNAFSMEELSEEMVRCMKDIFICLADPVLISSKFSPTASIHSPRSPLGHIASSSLSSFSESSSFLSFVRSPPVDFQIKEEVIGTENTFDPYSTRGKLRWADIGKYSSAVEVSWMSVGKQQLEYAAEALRKFRYRSLVEQLAKVDPSYMADNAKLAFWINLYNALIMHAYLAYGVPRSDLKLFSLMQKAAYTVGGHSFNAAAIEYVILKVKPPMHRPQIALLLALHKFKISEEQSKYSIEHSEPLVNFALSCGVYSSPAILFLVQDIRLKQKGYKQKVKEHSIQATDSQSSTAVDDSNKVGVFLKLLLMSDSLGIKELKVLNYLSCEMYSALFFLIYPVQKLLCKGVRMIGRTWRSTMREKHTGGEKESWLDKMEANSPAAEEEYGPTIFEEEQPSTSAVAPQQLKASEFAQNYAKGVTRVQGKASVVNKQVLSEATHALGIGKVWGKEWVKAEEFDRLIHDCMGEGVDVTQFLYESLDLNLTRTKKNLTCAPREYNFTFIPREDNFTYILNGHKCIRQTNYLLAKENKRLQVEIDRWKQQVTNLKGQVEEQDASLVDAFGEIANLQINKAQLMQLAKAFGEDDARIKELIAQLNEIKKLEQLKMHEFRDPQEILGEIAQLKRQLGNRARVSDGTDEMPNAYLHYDEERFLAMQLRSLGPHVLGLPIDVSHDMRDFYLHDWCKSLVRGIEEESIKVVREAVDIIYQMGGSNSREGGLLGEIAQLKRVPDGIDEMLVMYLHYDEERYLTMQLRSLGALLLEEDDFRPGLLMGDVHLRRMMSILRAKEWRSRQIELFGGNESIMRLQVCRVGQTGEGQASGEELCMATDAGLTDEHWS